MTSLVSRLKRRLFDFVTRPLVRRFPLQMAEVVSEELARLSGNPAQGLFARHGFQLTRAEPSGAVPSSPGSGQIYDDRQALAVAESLAGYLSRHDGTLAHGVFKRYGFHLLRKHFYLPIPDEIDIERPLAAEPSELVGVDMNDAAGLDLLNRVFPPYVREFRSRFPVHPRPDQAAHEFYLINSSYMAVDAQVYYALIREFKPRRIVEIGSGNSTLLAGASALANRVETGQTTELIAIEPYPQEFLRQGVPGLSRLIEAKAQDVDLNLFTSLQAGDILFIDSSHVLRAGGDVHLEYLEILPRLQPSVLVHIHDISLPKPYPRVYFDHLLYWNEQYLLQAFLAFNRRFDVIWPGNYMLLPYPDQVMAVFPELTVMREHYPMSEPSAFWLRVRPQS